MHILALSIGPIGPDIASGGATKCLLDLGYGLSKRGYRINILGPNRPNFTRTSKLNANLSIHAVLPYRPSFPGAYDIPPYQHVRMVEELIRFQADSDLIYVHDAGFLHRDWFRLDVPLVVSLRDLLYQETLLGAMSFRRDLLIVNSSYLYDCILATVGNIRPKIRERIHVIENGIDWATFRPGVHDERITTVMANNTLTRPILLHPHRPDPRKGLPFVFEVLRKIKRLKDFGSVTLLVPRHSLDGHFEIQSIPADLQNHIVTHQWLPRSLMPAYYGLGDVTLCLGEFVEAFGSNVVLESIACGVPVVQTMVAAHRNTVPDGSTIRVNPGDVDEAVEAIALAVSQGSHSVLDWRELLSKQFSLDRMIDSYESLFMEAKVLPPLQVRQSPEAFKDFKVRLAPWCFAAKGRIYHDYLGIWYEHPLSETLVSLVGSESRPLVDIEAVGFDSEVLDELLVQGYLVKEYASRDS